MQSQPYQGRLKQLQSKLSPESDLLITNPQHIYYLTGFASLNPGEREAYLLVNNKQTTLFYASFSPIKKQSLGKYIPKCSLTSVLASLSPITNLAVDMKSLTASEYQKLRKLPLTLSEWDERKIWQLRMHKDSTETKLMVQAREITKKALERILATIKPGMTEIDVRRNLDAQMLLFGADSTAFPTIVAFGKHSALPHHQPTDKKLAKEMVVLIDCGAQIGHYCADMTRTIWFGDDPDLEFIKIDAVVRQAFAAAQNAIQQKKPTAQSIDVTAREVIMKAGYGKQFIHTTGHGLGLSIHEPPSLSSRNRQTIEASMAITIEPGIYLPGRFGSRFENTLLL